MCQKSQQCLKLSSDTKFCNQKYELKHFSFNSSMNELSYMPFTLIYNFLLVSQICLKAIKCSSVHLFTCVLIKHKRNKRTSFKTKKKANIKGKKSFSKQRMKSRYKISWEAWMYMCIWECFVVFVWMPFVWTWPLMVK